MGDLRKEAVERARTRGAVQILCDEIKFRFEPAMERPDILVAFVRQLVANVADMHGLDTRIGHLTGKPPSESSGRVLKAAIEMVEATERADLIRLAETVHDLSHELNPEDAYPTDHMIDMLSSCASAIRFGLEMPCHSRHAASAAHHIWTRRYGISLEDDFTSAWCHDWGRVQLQRAILGLSAAPAPLSEEGTDG